MDALADLRLQLCRFYGLGHAVLLGRARAAFPALAQVLQLGGRQALIPSNLCPAVPVALDAAGMAPRLVAVDPAHGLAGDERLLAALQQADARPGLLMPTHLYGRRADYAHSTALARAQGWFVLENDTLCAARVQQGRRQAFGDAVLTSFGYAKTASAGGGGAVLTDDAALAAELTRCVAAWPALDSAALEAETALMQACRALREQGRHDRIEQLQRQAGAQLRHAFPPALAPAVQQALSQVEPELARRRAVAERWDCALQPFDDLLAAPAGPGAGVCSAPWRLIRRVQPAARRDGVAAALRGAGLDAGINFPALADGLPGLLGDQAQADARLWGASVLNLWLDAHVDAAQMRQATEALGRLTLQAA